MADNNNVEDILDEDTSEQLENRGSSLKKPSETEHQKKKKNTTLVIAKNKAKKIVGGATDFKSQAERQTVKELEKGSETDPSTKDR